MTSWMRPGTRVSEGLTQLGRDGGSSFAKGTVKLKPKGIEERRSSLELRSYAAALAPAISAQIAKLWARAARYWVAVM